MKSPPTGTTATGHSSSIPRSSAARSSPGSTHMPTPTKVMWFTNVNLHQQRQARTTSMIRNVNPRIDLIATTDIEMTLVGASTPTSPSPPTPGWRCQTHEITASCSNPFLQVWRRTASSRSTKRRTTPTSSPTWRRRSATNWRTRASRTTGSSSSRARTDVYIQRLLDASITTKGYRLDDILAGKYGEPGAALMLFRTYPRIPFQEQITREPPVLHRHRASQQLLRHPGGHRVRRELHRPPRGPGGHAVPPERHRLVQPIRTPRGLRHPVVCDGGGRADRPQRQAPVGTGQVHHEPAVAGGLLPVLPDTQDAPPGALQLGTSDWSLLWDSNFADPYRADPRSPGWVSTNSTSTRTTARSLGIEDGDYVYVDANPADRPYVGWKAR